MRSMPQPRRTAWALIATLVATIGFTAAAPSAVFGNVPTPALCPDGMPTQWTDDVHPPTTVRVLRAEGWTEEDLRRALSGLVRKLPRRLGEVPARPLGEAAAVRVIGELAHDDGVGSAQETWPGLRVGGLAQATFRLPFNGVSKGWN